ncbi:MAG: hypothetical protein K2H18_01940, partial [Muribaculaceae bacterium]|nr:hypothetical protein [Muribaculaceae bacterium]
MKKLIIIFFIILFSLPISALYRMSLLKSSEMKVSPEDIFYLPGYGIGLACGEDSVMLIDNPELSSVRWIEPTHARSIVGCGEAFYVADGDSISRLASDSLPKKFIGRLDNEQFTLSVASDSTFFAVTADEDFSCVYEINPITRYCEPIISIMGPLQKIAKVNDKILLWVDDTIMFANSDGTISPFYSAPNITDVEISPIGIFIGTDRNVMWFTGLNEGFEILSEGVSKLWWDHEDYLYYMTTQNN